MDDIMNKISEMLSDEESVKQLSELAQMLVSEGDGDDTEEKGTSETDISSLLKLSGIIGEAGRQDKNCELLLALKPHLGKEKQNRVDKALKLLKVLTIWNTAKDSGLLQELI